VTQVDSLAAGDQITSPGGCPLTVETVVEVGAVTVVNGPGDGGSLVSVAYPATADVTVH
jgi:hypothetical protein